MCTINMPSLDIPLLVNRYTMLQGKVTNHRNTHILIHCLYHGARMHHRHHNTTVIHGNTLPLLFLIRIRFLINNNNMHRNRICT